MKIFLIVISIIAVVAVVCLAVWLIRAYRFKPTKDKQKQKEMLNADLEAAGFAYEPKGDYFYSLMYCWQRKVGYCRLYDEGAPLFNMIMDCEPVAFSYGGKRWLIELWKGQYGITTGAEIGIYNTSREDVHTDRFTGTFYESISDAERLPLSFVLRKDRKKILKRKALHWWLTAFKLGEFSQPSDLTMDAKIKFPNHEMCAAFTEALSNIGYQRGEFSVHGATVSIHFDKPHSPQPPAQEGISKAVVQRVNENNCQLFEFATSKYPDTLDKLEFIKASMPELYHLFLNSLYSKGFFEMFNWLLDLIFGQRPEPTPPTLPCPPVPTCPPDPPCQPSPPCPPCPPYTPPHYCPGTRCYCSNYAARYQYGARRQLYSDSMESEPPAILENSTEKEVPSCRR